MSEARQRAYLEALEIPVWVRKELADHDPGFIAPDLKLGPGSSNVLLVCAAVDEPAMHVATDIARSLKSEPVWAWPESQPGNESDDAETGSDITAIVNEHLFTNIVLFGGDLAGRIFNGAPPETLGSARSLLAPGLDELAQSPAARQNLWALISRSHLTGPVGKTVPQ